jgi:hypothetical protein
VDINDQEFLGVLGSRDLCKKTEDKRLYRNKIEAQERKKKILNSVTKM